MKLYDTLFETGALKISPANLPFFYTSGKLGPFYINTHFLFGGEKSAEKLLSRIDKVLESDKGYIPSILSRETISMYSEDPVYKAVIDHMTDMIVKTVDIEDVGYVSAGERRDWFFSFPVAKLLGKTHLTIFKNKSIIPDAQDIKGDIIHITDLVTEASSFFNTWVPALSRSGKKISAVYSVVDRKQGGEEYFKSINTGFFSLIDIDEDFFLYAYENSYINKAQLNMILRYIASPDECMKEFLTQNRSFLENAINAGGKTKEKARILIEKNIYGLPKQFLDLTDV